ncbi:hypothetical protein SMSP2_00979 [Limihaloglobus sulfuriphilus]|uniref:HEAT repeat n=1 Tax=Limihaloglobus sulfuriphilus TaxID=1851148 RepID=A0A1Q2MD54_9BACT|nr:hypothetical protein [Limihaloglobus sulfuriphilus]AQQ70625.1 hypothetical protein SMSP2_00979 [Limihaloglobus sulfuriphilus]
MSKSFFALFFVLFASLFASAQNGAEKLSTEQLEITKAALVTGSELELRKLAAKQLLQCVDKSASDFLVETLTAENNLLAKRAVCLAISETRNISEKITYRENLAPAMVGLLKTQSRELLESCSRAMVVFDYAEVRGLLMDMIKNQDLEMQVRLNVFGVLSRFVSERAALEDLYDLSRSETPEISQGATETLEKWVPSDENEDLFWENVIEELGSKSPDEVIRDLMQKRQKRIATLQESLLRLTDEHLGVIEDLYRLQPAEAREKTIISSLNSRVAQVRLWAIRKVGEWKSSQQLPESFAEPLLAIISDTDTTVRREAARLMLLMSDLRPQQQLVAAMEKENRRDVFLLQYEALVQACYYDFLSPRTNGEPGQAVDRAVEFTIELLKSENALDTAAGIRGSGRIFSIPSKNANMLVEGLNLIKEKYEQFSSQEPVDIELSLRVLDAMVQLCNSASINRDNSSEIFRPLFLRALESGPVQIRVKGLEGLASVNLASAVENISESKLYLSQEPALVQSAAAVAMDGAAITDVGWLIEASSVNEEFYEVLVKLFRSGEAARIAEFCKTVIESDLKAEHKTGLLEIAESKAPIQTDVRVMLVRYCLKQNDFARAIKYLEKFAAAGAWPNHEELLLEIMNAAAAAGDADSIAAAAKVLVDAGDTADKGGLVKPLDEYFSNPEVKSAAKHDLLKRLSEIDPEKTRADWNKRLGDWRSKLVNPQEQEKAQQPEPAKEEAEKPSEAAKEQPNQPAEPAKAEG